MIAALFWLLAMGCSTRAPEADPNKPNSEACKALHVENMQRLTRLEQRGINTDPIVNDKDFENYPNTCIMEKQEKLKNQIDAFMSTH